MTHLGNLLTNLKNSQLRKKETINVPYTNLIVSVCEILKARNFIRDFEIVEGKFKQIKISLSYPEDGSMAILSAKLVSKPGVRKYQKAIDIRPLLNGRGLRIVSTPKGIKDGMEAQKMNLGGELLCEVY